MIKYDGAEAIRVAKRNKFKPSTNLAYFDLVSTLHRIINNKSRDIEFLCIYRYQDKARPFQKLTNLEKLNIISNKKSIHIGFVVILY